MFEKEIEKVVMGADGCQAGVLMGLDGIAVHSYKKEESIDIDSLGMEFSFILNQVRNAGESLEVGALGEFCVQSEKLTMVMRMLNDEYFLGVAMVPNSSVGKCRYLMRLAGARIEAEL